MYLNTINIDLLMYARQLYLVITGRVWIPSHCATWMPITRFVALINSAINLAEAIQRIYDSIIFMLTLL